MRMVLLCILLSGCGVIDRIADGGAGAYGNNRVFLGSDSVRIKVRRDMEKYTCGNMMMVCEHRGGWECSCQKVSWSQF